MKNIVFFIENKWAFGSIHHGLQKLLWEYGYNCEVLDFFTQYEMEEMKRIDANTHLFLTTPAPATWLMNYGVAPEKIYAVAHAEWDILLAKHQNNLDFNSLGKYGVVSNILFEKSHEYGVDRKPELTTLGIFFDRFYAPVADKLESIGYGAAEESYNFFGKEWKRGKLVKQLAANTGLPFVVSNKYHYLAMPAFYKSVHSIIMSSSEEGAGLPVMEAAAAGRLTLGTPVGCFRDIKLSGLHLPIDEGQYLEQGTNVLNWYKENPDEYKKRCLEIQEYARYNYDWQYHIESWVKFLQ